MKRFLFIPDSFKETLSSVEICRILEQSAEEIFPDCQTYSIPVADGGEGSVDCFLHALNGEKVTLKVKNPYMEDMEAYYGLIDQGQTAVIEMAACAGLPLVENRKNPKMTTTFGVGQLILDAAERGAKKIVIGLGGSCTNDGGCGAAAAVGIKFLNEAGEVFTPTGGTLKDIGKIDFSGRDKSLENITITIMCDVDNPMYGPTGAAYIFGPQKGADEKMVLELDDGLKQLCSVIERVTGRDLSQVPGAGAAGAMGAGMMAFFNSNLQMGIETVLDTVGFDRMIHDVDLIITGEGKLDSQSLRGKAVIGVARRAKKKNKPVLAIVGGIDDSNISEIYEAGVTAAFSINRLPQDLSVSKRYSEENLRATAVSIFRLLRI